MKSRVTPWLAHGANGVVATLFLAAGLLKLADPAAFARELSHFRLTPAPFNAALALYLPSLESIVGIALFVPRLRAAARWLAAGMLALFSAALLSALARGLDIRCGCFGEGAAMSVSAALVRNAILAALLALAWRMRIRMPTE